MEQEARRGDGAIDVVDGWGTDDRPPSIALVETIAAIEGIDPLDVDFTLADTVEPDALDRLFCEEKLGEIVVRLSVDGYFVTISNEALRVEADGFSDSKGD